MSETQGKGKGKLQDTIDKVQKSIDYNKVENDVANAQTNVQNSVRTTVGQVMGSVRGGIESITESNKNKIANLKLDAQAKFDELSNVTTEGLINDGIESLDNMKNDAINTAISKVASKFGAKVEIEFTEPDSNGMTTIKNASLEPEGGLSQTISGILQLITGLGAGPLTGQALSDAIEQGTTDLAGELQQQVIDATTEGVLDAVARVEGKVGAFASVEALTQATEDAVTSVLNGVPIPEDINQALEVPLSPSDVGSDGLGALVINRSTLANVNVKAPTLEDSAFRDNLLVKGQNDLKNIMFKDQEVKKNVKGLSKDIADLTGIDPETAIESTVKKSESIETVQNSGNEYEGQIKRVSGDNTLRGNIQSLSIKLNPDVVKDLQIAAPTLSIEEIDRIVDLAQSGNDSDVSRAADIVQSKSVNAYDDIKEQIKQINTTVTENNKLIENYQVFAEPYVIGSSSKDWEKGRGNPVFPYVSSVEELNAEFQNITRDITSMIVHWTETHTNRNIGSEDINQYHLDLGIEGLGYHYVIRRDGSIQRGRPVNLEGEHTPDFDKGSIGVVFVGGINAPTGTENSENFVSAASLTRTQVNSFDHLCRAFLNRFDNGYIFGHNDVDADEFDPGFDVIEYTKSRFGIADYSVEDL